MSKIDELPLDMFGSEDGPAAAAALEQAPPVQAGWDQAAVASASAVETTRAHDAIAVVLLVVGLGLAMRVTGMSFAIPVANGVLAPLLFFRARKMHRQWYYERAVLARERIASEIAAHGAEPFPEQVTTYRLPYDAAIVVAMAVLIHIAAWMSGLDRIIPDRIDAIVSLAAAIAAYLAIAARGNRSVAHAVIYRRSRQVMDSVQRSGST